MTRKEDGAETRKWMAIRIPQSTSDYAHFSENTISKLQQAYLKKYYPRQYSHSTWDALNKGLEGKKSGASRQQNVILETEPAQSDDGIADISNIR